MKRYYLIFITAAIISVLSIGDVHSQNNTHLSIGIADYYSKDEIVSNSIFEGYTTKFSLIHKRDNSHQIYFHHLFGELYSRNDHQWKMFSTQITYRYFIVNFGNSTFSHLSGLSFTTKGMWINSTFYSGDISGNGRESGYLNSALSISHLSKIKLTKKLFSNISFNLPFLYYTLRPGYSILDPDRTIGNGATAFNVARSGKFRTLLKQPSLTVGVNLFYPLKNNLFITGGYTYHYLEINFPKEFSSVEQSFEIGLRWKL